MMEAERQLGLAPLRSPTALSVSGSWHVDLGRVGTPSRPGAPLTEPDLWASHPALRDSGVPDGRPLSGRLCAFEVRAVGIPEPASLPAAIPCQPELYRGGDVLGAPLRPLLLDGHQAACGEVYVVQR